MTNTLTKHGVTRSVLVLALVVLLAAMSSTNLAHAKDGTVLSGVVVGVETDESGNLTRLAISDSSGQITTLEFVDNTQFGLENQAGDRWVSSYADDPAEAARRLRDHRERFAPITVTFENGIAHSVVEREEGKLETNLGYLFAVFAITWAIFFAYILYMNRKQRVLQHEIARLKGAIGQ